MVKLIVQIAEVHYQDVEIDAIDKTTAFKKIEAGEGQYLDNTLEYSHTLDTEKWCIKEV